MKAKKKKTKTEHLYMYFCVSQNSIKLKPQTIFARNHVFSINIEFHRRSGKKIYKLLPSHTILPKYSVENE